MKKRFLAALLAAVLGASLLVGCGGDKNSDDGKKDTADQGKVETISIYLMSPNVTDGVDEVEKAINEYIEPKIGANVDITFINPGSYQDTVAQMVRTGDPLDICFLSETNLRSLVSQEAVHPLNDLIAKYGDGIIDAVGRQFVEAAYINGELYAIPSKKDMALCRMLVYRKDIAEECGVVDALNNARSIYDLTDIYAKVAEKYPDMDMFGGAPNAQTFVSWTWDALSDSLGVLMDYGKTSEVTNVFETDEYMKLCKLVRTWYTNGWIDRDIATGTDFWNNRIKAGNTFSGMTSYKPGNVETCSAQVGYELGYVVLMDPLRCTSNVMNATLSIPESSKHPEKAMQFLKLWYTDPVVANLIINGVEGTHYKVLDDGTIDYVGTADTCTYYNYSMGWIMGNQFITHVWSGTDPKVWEQTNEWNETAVSSKAFGFAWDNSDYLNEVTACTNVLTKYRGDLETGTIDPEENIPKLIQELKDNGIDKIIKAKQEQLNKFLGQ